MNRRNFLATGLAAFSTPALAVDLSKFKPISLQYLAALGDPSAKSGTGAETWGLWTLDPGPRGVRLSHYQALKDNNYVAPAAWKFDPKSWWLEEHGLIMEQPQPFVPAGRYLVTGDRDVQTALTINPKDSNGAQRWALEDDATLYDVTHLRCRAARYTPGTDGPACNPDMVDTNRFPIPPGEKMPLITGCNTQDYSVLFVVGVEA